MFVRLELGNGKGDYLQIFRLPQGWFYAQTFGEMVMDRGQKIGIFRFSRDRSAMRHGRQAGWVLRWALDRL